MTWYDGGPPPDPTRRRDRPRDGAPGETPEASSPAPAVSPPVPPVPLPGDPVTRARLRAAAAPPVPPDPPPWSEDPRPRPHRAGGRPAVLVGLRWRVPVRTALAALVALALVGGAVALRAAPTATGPVVDLPEPVPATPAASAQASAPATASPGPEVWVHVVGEVAAPGVFALPAGSRVGEAVVAAGGALPGADLASVNLAAVVVDGAQVRVPAPGEGAGPAVVHDGQAAGGGGAGGGAVDADGTVDVNRADAAELQTLPGIGPVLADRVVTWRSEHGAFATTEDLQDVPGIGPALMARIADRVRASRHRAPARPPRAARGVRPAARGRCRRDRPEVGSGAC